jgi:ribonuclease E
MSKKMLIDATHPEETRVVVVDGNKVEDFDFESINKRQLAGNIYLAKVTRVEPSLQAAFVDYGGNRHGFLAFAEIHPDYYQIPVADREALLAEEEREARAEEAAEAEQDKPARRTRRTRKAKEEKAEKPAKPARRGRSRSEKTQEKAEGADAPAEKPRRARRGGAKAQSSGGLDVIEPEGETPAPPEGDVPKGLEVTDLGTDESGTGATAPASGGEAAATPEAAEPAPLDAVVSGGAEEADSPVLEQALGTVPEDASETAGGAAAEPPATEESALPEAAATPLPDSPAPGSDPGAEAESSDAAGEDDSDGEGETGADTDDGEGTGGSGPRSIAEASGLDDERVSEDVATVAEGEEETAEGRSRGSRGSGGRKTRSTRTRKGRAKEEPEEAEAAEAPEIEQSGAEDVREEVDRERLVRKRRYKIQDVIKVRQIMLVQVVKEERGNKGAALTTYLSLAGRYCVLMPNTARGGGISRKISNAADRKRLREIVGELEVPKGMGLIVRTAGAERTRPEIKRDYDFLLRQWEQIRELTLKSIAPCLIYEEGSLIKRAIRDLYSREIEQVLVEGEAGYREAKDYMKMLMPSHAKNVKQYADPIPLFIRYQVESYLNGMFSPVVTLKSGGYIVIGVTEALVAIDVNSGRSTKQGSVEDTALKTNLEAADEIALQLRLRDLAGLIVIDFIDMDENRNNRAVEKRMKERLKTDRARLQIGRISAFGLMEMSRQRLRPGMLEASTKPCPHCHGTGTIRSDESLSLAILREIEEEAVRGRISEVIVTAPVEIANFLINSKRAHVARLEERHGIRVGILGDPALTSPEYRVERIRAPAKGAEEAAGAVITASGSMAAPAPEPSAPAVEAKRAESKAAEEPAQLAAGGDDGQKRRRRGKRGGRRRRAKGEEAGGAEEAAAETGSEAADEAGPSGSGAEADTSEPAAETATAEAAPVEPAAEAATAEPSPAPEPEEKPARKPRARGGRRTKAKTAEEAPAGTGPEPGAAGEAGTPPAAEAAAPPAPSEVVEASAGAAVETTAEAAEAAAREETPTAAAEPATETATAGAEGEAGAAPAAAETPAVAEAAEPEPAHAAAGAPGSDGAAGETAKEPAAPEQDQSDREKKPKRRGWWTFGF